ncbi:MAG: prepilin-type N-terminal cleavage/methylation domain-containing protein [Lentisphaerae bacterium]|nr:prepilin-type N-terminal cleavage/methylation domain-containing protein [Lentisphaerota bacterium]
MNKIRCGFTLIEMLVVIVILGVLVALIVPSVTRAREKGWEKRCAGNLRQLYAGALTHGAEKTWYPRGRSFIDEYDRRHSGWIHWVDWDSPDSYRYTGAEAESNIKGGTLWPYMGGQIAVYSCPTHVRTNAVVVRSYAMYADMCGSGGGSYQRVLTIRDASQKIFFGEVTEARLAKTDDGSFFVTTNNLAYRHNGRANIVYADGHQESRAQP